MFQRATKAQAKLRMAIYGPPGSGKTYTALLLACGLAGPGGRVAVIDSERGSASKYADLFSFDTCQLGTDPRDATPFHPARYEAAIESASREGYAAIVIDSLSHAWSGKGGVLEVVDSITARNKGNSFRSWGGADGGTALQNHLVDTILRSSCHIIVTMRSKVEYVVETNLKGNAVPRRVGTAPVQRGDVEYEFDVIGDMDHSNSMTILKSRCISLSGRVIPKPDSLLSDELASWLSDGEKAPSFGEIEALAAQLSLAPEQFTTTIQSRYGARMLSDLSPQQLFDIRGRLQSALASRPTNQQEA